MNSVIVTGRLTKDAILGQTTKGTPFAKFTLASDKSKKKGKYGDNPEANFIPFELYGKKAEALGEFLKQGTSVWALGSIQTSKYAGEDGQTKYSWRVICEKLEFLPEGAMNGMNNTNIVGRLTDDAKTSYTPDGVCIQEFTIASGRHDKEKNADYIRVTLYGMLGEALGRYLIKGKSVTVDGRLDTGSYKNQAGTTVFTWRVVADEIYLNGSGKKKLEQPDESGDAEQVAAMPAEPENQSSEFEDLGFIELPPGFDDEYFD